MRVGIICAGDREVAPFLPIICECKTTEKAMLKFYEGTISNVEVVVLFSGVCKVNAAIATQILIDTYHVNTIINAGVAGRMNEKLEIFDTVISTEVENLHQNYKVFWGRMVTGEAFIADEGREKINEQFEPLQLING